MAQEEKAVEQPKEDNLIDVLSDFNESAGVTSSLEGSDTEETNEQAQNRQSAVEYLINNKFQDTPDGRQQLAKAYTELQSKTDKEKTEYNQKTDHYGRLDKLDGYLKENPEAVKMLQSRIKDEKQSLAGPPSQPEDYDILDEGTKGTTSNEWRDTYNQWLIDQGRDAAKKEVDGFKEDLAKQELARRDDQELTDLGLNGDDKDKFRKFLNDPGEMNNKTLVQVWRFLNGDGAVMPSGNGAAKKNLQTSAAAVSGNTPSAITPQSEELDTFWDGIMSTTNRVGGSR